MSRAPTLLIAALTLAVPAQAFADTKAEKAKKAKAKKAKADKAQADKDMAEAEAEAAAAAAAAEAEANPTPDAGADADLLKSKAAIDADAEAEKAKADADKPDGAAAVVPEPPEPVAAPRTGGAPLTIGRGRLVIAGSTLNVNLSSGAVGEPVSLAPSVWFGVTDKISVGLTHDGGTTAWSPRPGVRVTTKEELGITDTEVSGSGICVTGKDANCAKPYNNVGVDALIGITDGKFSVAGHVGVDALSLEEMTLGTRLGVLGRFAATSKVSIVFDPRVQLAITDREFTGDRLDIPLWVWFEPATTLGFYVHTGLSGPFDGLGDSFNVPVGVGASFHASPKLTLGADFHFSNLLGKGSSADGRVLGVRVAVTL